MSKNTNQYRFDSADLLFYLWDNRKPLLFITGLAAIVSIVVSLLIEEKYKSEVIVFPAAAGSISQDLISDSYSEKSLLKLGQDEELEQLMQVLLSDEIRDRVIDQFDLMKHYKIEPDSKYPFTTLYKKYAQNIKIEPTQFLSIKITVLDRDPQLAADMANSICNLIDSVMNGMQKAKALEALKLVENEYLNLQKEVSKMQDSLNYYRAMGIVDYNSQVEVLTEAYGNAVVENNKEGAKTIQQKLDLLAKYGGAYSAIADNLTYQIKQLSFLKSKYAEAAIDANQQLPKKFVVNKAIKAEKKSYPIRWLIVVTSTFGAFIITLLGLVVYDSVVRRYEELYMQKK